MAPSQRPVRQFAARWFLLNNSRFALIQGKSFPLAPRYDEPVQHCVVPPGELPGLQWEPPGSLCTASTHTQSRKPQVPHLYLGCRLCLNWYLFLDPFECLKLVRGPWTLPFPKVYLDGCHCRPCLFPRSPHPPFNRRSNGWFG